jgi:hypothetical protein
MAKYIKIATKVVVEARRSDNFWAITHADGDTTYLTDPKFRKRYVNEDGTPLPEPKPAKKEKAEEKTEKKERKPRDDNKPRRSRRTK